MPNAHHKLISAKTIERLSLYRRVLGNLIRQSDHHVYSHSLAALLHSTPAQVRRDLMLIGFSGSPSRGYNIQDLRNRIDEILDAPNGHRIALVGVGNLGRALLAYIIGQRSKLEIVVAFDRDPSKTGRLIHGIPCLPIVDLADTLRTQSISLAILAVPQDAAQSVVDALVAAGIRGILNFVPIPIRVPPQVSVEDLDMMMSLEKLAYFSRSTSTSE